MWQKGFSSENLALDNQATNSNGIGFHQTGSNVPLRAERYARKRQRVEEFKSQIVELPQLPELSHFEALRPCADPNLIAPDVKNLLQEQNQRQISELLPKKFRFAAKLASTSSTCKAHRAE